MVNKSIFSIKKLRKDTPGCFQVIHLNNAGASLMTQQTLNIMLSHLKMEAKIGAYEAARLKADKIDSVYESIAKLINAQPCEIAITESATRAFDMAFFSIRFNPGDIILTSDTDYISNNIAYMQMAEKNEVVVKLIPNEENGDLSVSALENMIDSKVKLIAVTHVPSNAGLVQPIASVGKVANRYGILFLLDACQSVGQMPIDINEIGCDILSATGRKYLRGPRGTGFLFVRKALIDKLEPPFLDTHSAKWTGDSYHIRSDGKRFENWEFNVAAKLGLGAAVDYALKIKLSDTYAYIQSLASILRQQLGNIKGVTVYDKGTNLCGIVTFTIKNIKPVEIRNILMRQNINVSS